VCSVDDQLFDLLKREMHTRHWNVSRLAEACGADVALTSRWVAENPERRVTPGPRSCQKIAEALDLDPDYVLELAGHRKPQLASSRPSVSVQQRHIDQEYDRWMEIMTPRMGEAVAHDAFWDPFVAEAKSRRETLERALYAPGESAVYPPDNADHPRLNRASKPKKADNRTLSVASLLGAACLNRRHASAVSAA
jgi:transcriptional regulator with XRE-family HTH domain